MAADMLRSGAWLKGVELRKLRRSLCRKQAAAACSNCKRRKRKCDNQRPCGQCVSKGLSRSCGDEGATEGTEEGLLKAIDLALAQRIDPERPVAFPEEGFCGLVRINTSQSPWPKSLMMTMKLFRYSDAVTHRILNNMSPKLQDAVLRIYRPIDAVMGRTDCGGAEPQLPKDWQQTSAWQNSTRCGVQMVRVDRNMRFFSGINTNSFFTNLAGLHKEEYVHRTFNGDMNLPTSELRQLVKLILNGAEVGMKVRIAEMTGTQYIPELNTRPLYSRFSNGWGRGGESEGVLTRMTFSTTYENLWQYTRNSIVIISPEEYEAVRATEPELCEGYLTPVVGSKSARELMDPRLLVEESFAHMNSCPEGRAQMDTLADLLLDRFRFMFDFLAERNLWLDSPTGGADYTNPALPAAAHNL